MTALGGMRLSRPYRVQSGEGSFPADADLGLDGYLTTQAKRLATLAGVMQSFAKARILLDEMCGWKLDEETIRLVTHAAAKAASKARATREDASRFATAGGEIEVAIDAGKVNTRIGWKDVKIALFLRRIAGHPATPAQWDSRTLPRPTIRVVVAAVEEAETFTMRMQTESDRLNATLAGAISVLGDGAEWIWNLSETVFPLADEVLDVFHAVERISDAVKAVWGDTEAAKSRIAAGRQAILTRGKLGVERWLAETIAEVPMGTSTGPLLEAAAYLAKHPTRMDYAERLTEGRSIGSGAVEGAVKQLLNLRMKRTGARWKVEHVGPLVELIALSETPEWDAVWTAA
jgi:hypothetical protein